MQNVHQLLKNIKIDYITKMNDLIYAGAVFVAEKLNMFKEKAKKSNSAWDLR